MLYLPQNIPASEWIPSVPYDLPLWQEQGEGMKVLFLNLMPQKEVTEWDFIRSLGASHIDLQLIPLKISGQTYKTTHVSHMKDFYLDFENVEEYYFDRMIITGAPLEQMAFEEVRYWKQLCHIMEWADVHVKRTLYVCWAAQAGLYFHYGINKYPLPNKCFGIFEQNVLNGESPLMHNLQPSFKMPNSRHTEVMLNEVQSKASAGLQIIATSSESGVGIVSTKDISRTFVTGHLEYEPYTLEKEFQRDLRKNLPINPPIHYYNGVGDVVFSWKKDAEQFYLNWLRNE